MTDQNLEKFPTIDEFKMQLESWQDLLKPYLNSPKFEKIYKFIQEKYKTEKCYPKPSLIFNAFKTTKLDEIKVVIVGQDPYHQPGQAMGLAFSVPKNFKIPPSLVNIYKGLDKDKNISNFKIPKHGDLTKWAQQGVFLINTVLTVTDSKPNSHKKCGWTNFTDHVIKTLSDKTENLVYILWGGNAKQKQKYIDEKKHLVIKCVHPSPLSAHQGFFDSKQFSELNEYLKSKGKKEIDWNLEQLIMRNNQKIIFYENQKYKNQIYSQLNQNVVECIIIIF